MSTGLKKWAWNHWQVRRPLQYRRYPFDSLALLTLLAMPDWLMPDSGFNSDCEMIPFIINGEAFNSLESHLVCPAFTVPRCDGSRKPALRLARQLMKCEIPLSDSSSNAKVTHDVFYELCYLEFNVGTSGDPTSVAVKLIEGKPYIVLDRERLCLWNQL